MSLTYIKNPNSIILSVTPANIDAVPDFCEDSSPVTFTATAAGGKWRGLGIDSLSGLFDPSIISPGTYEIIYTFGSGTCEVKDTTTVLVGSTPIVTAGGDEEICEGSAAFTLITPFPATGGKFTVCLEVTSACGKVDSTCQIVELNNVVSTSDFSKTDKIKITHDGNKVSIAPLVCCFNTERIFENS